MWRNTLSKLYRRRNFGINSRPTQVATKYAPEESLSVIQKLKIGEDVHGFRVEQIRKISEFNLTAIKLLHKITSAEYLHLYRNDNNNAFSINFRTTPKNSTGLPHILEHTVLCGSELYPVRDPFFKMLNRSLATFMNAMTGSDYTLYPFSTQNYTDFTNLQKIYLDAVFRPKLKLLDFLQEGWRLENTDPEDPKSDIIIKGVVYNEMKGVFSENENIYMQKLQNLILPDHTYGVISGGDPLEIPNLTWDDLKTFHENFYHPSNAKFFSYGNFPLVPSLQYLNEEYLSKATKKADLNTYVPPQEKWTEPKEIEIFGRYESMKESFEKQNMISISCLMTDITNLYQTFLVNILSDLLVKGMNAPFYKSMIEPNFSGGFTQSTGFDTQPRDSIFTLGLQSIKKEDFDRFLKIFDDTIDNVIKNGFDPKHVESVLHRYELGIKHELKNFGLHAILGLTPLWNHGGDIIDFLQVNKHISTFKREMSQDKQYLQKAVEKYFKNNNHKLILKMLPDKEYENKMNESEKELIHKKVSGLTTDQKKEIFERGQELLKELNTKPNTEILPSLKMNDISNEVEHFPIEKTSVGPVSTQMNIVNSNGVTYFKGLLNTSELTLEQQMLLPLLCYVIDKLGTNHYSYREFDQLINLKTGGLNLTPHIGESLYQLHSYEPGIFISSYCLDGNLDYMLDLWQELFQLTELKDVKRFENLTQLYMANLTNGMVDSGHVYAMQAASGLVSGTEYQKDLLMGLQHINYMKNLIKTRNYEAMLAEISNIIKIVFNKNRLRCALNMTRDNQVESFKMYEKFINDLPSSSMGTPNENNYRTSNVWTPSDAVNCQHHILNIPVHFCSKSILTVPYTDPDHSKLKVLARLLSTLYLFPEIREKNGAYGGGASLTSSGVFTFYSYRDPRSLQTLDVFDESLNWLQTKKDDITEQDILEAKLGVFQNVDGPVPPSNKGLDEFLKGLSKDILQRHRVALMTVKESSILKAGERYLGDDNAVNSSKVVLGPKSDDFDTSKRLKELWTAYEG
ncbi:presequence protease, mitochondrial [Agrilus planipennis]|uniref:Presequence protease, mitochondrial n=1 Tax=Agrilus planipennis TaxID=224129 RepID=A0A1W4XDQ5_AGRPL|nr:presequence protease, mitochondrial [Agrilus planipennis]XP_018330907.1 presequence protease, mitochondrial [Agrilus planipennis]